MKGKLDEEEKGDIERKLENGEGNIMAEEKITAKIKERVRERRGNSCENRRRRDRTGGKQDI